jgi:hypothetical protein
VILRKIIKDKKAIHQRKTIIRGNMVMQTTDFNNEYTILYYIYTRNKLRMKFENILHYFESYKNAYTLFKDKNITLSVENWLHDIGSILNILEARFHEIPPNSLSASYNTIRFLILKVRDTANEIIEFTTMLDEYSNLLETACYLICYT